MAALSVAACFRTGVLPASEAIQATRSKNAGARGRPDLAHLLLAGTGAGLIRRAIPPSTRITRMTTTQAAAQASRLSGPAC